MSKRRSDALATDGSRPTRQCPTEKGMRQRVTLFRPSRLRKQGTPQRAVVRKYLVPSGLQNSRSNPVLAILAGHRIGRPNHKHSQIVQAILQEQIAIRRKLEL